MKNPHIIFKSIEGKIKAGVVELPEKPNEKDFSGDQWKEEQASKNYYAQRQAALANPIFFKEEKDAIEIRTLLVRQEELKNENWDFELDKPYKIEGVEIEIFTMPSSTIRSQKFTHKSGGEQFAFIKQPKEQQCSKIEVAQCTNSLCNHLGRCSKRLPEQKEESQKYEIWKEGFKAGIEGLTFNDNPYKP